jgi:hypothetical protein
LKFNWDNIPNFSCTLTDWSSGMSEVGGGVLATADGGATLSVQWTQSTGAVADVLLTRARECAGADCYTQRGSRSRTPGWLDFLDTRLVPAAWATCGPDELFVDYLLPPSQATAGPFEAGQPDLWLSTPDEEALEIHLEVRSKPAFIEYAGCDIPL